MHLKIPQLFIVAKELALTSVLLLLGLVFSQINIIAPDENENQGN